MHPYRTPPTTAERAPVHDPEELVLFGLLVVIGAIPLVLSLARGVAFDGEATLGLLMVFAGVVGAVVRVARPRGTR